MGRRWKFKRSDHIGSQFGLAPSNLHRVLDRDLSPGMLISRGRSEDKGP